MVNLRGDKEERAPCVDDVVRVEVRAVEPVVDTLLSVRECDPEDDSRECGCDTERMLRSCACMADSERLDLSVLMNVTRRFRGSVERKRNFLSSFVEIFSASPMRECTLPSAVIRLIPISRWENRKAETKQTRCVDM